MRECVDLFSGLGGFALACKANGIETACFCEKDEKCRAFLRKAWPDVKEIHDDIKTFKGERFRGCFLLTAGVPCQPASRAGKQGGAKDDRWLWPDAIRVLGEVRPAWALFENPPGIGDVGLAGILSQVEAQGYAVRVFSIPACAVGSPHRRERYWIVCRRGDDATRNGLRETQSRTNRQRAWESTEQGGVAHTGHNADGTEQGNKLQECDRWHGKPTQSIMGNAELHGHNGIKQGVGEKEAKGGMLQPERSVARQGVWDNFTWLPCADGKVRRAPDDSVSMAHGLPVELLEGLGTEGRQTPEACEPHRSLLGALGNSIVWQVAAKVIEAIVRSEDE